MNICTKFVKNTLILCLQIVYNILIIKHAEFSVFCAKYQKVNNMKSVWTKETNIKAFPKLRHDIKTDVLIIGGGITGILTAFLLSERNIDYILVEIN